MEALWALVVMGLGITLLGIRQLDKVRANVSPRKVVDAGALLVSGGCTLALPPVISEIMAGRNDSALLLGLGINILVIAGAVMAVMSASKEGKKKLAELQLQKDEEAKRQAEAQAEAKRQARQAEAEAKRQREKRKETLLEEWLDVLGQWKAQDQKGEPRYPSVMALIKTQRERAEKEQDPEVKAWLMGNRRAPPAAAELD